MTMSIKPEKSYKMKKNLRNFIKINMNTGDGGGSSCKSGYNTGSGACYCGTGYTFGGK